MVKELDKNVTTKPVTRPRKFSKKTKMVFTLLAVLLVLVVGGAISGYLYLNNKPEKVLADALTNSVTDLLAKKPATTTGTFTYVVKGGKFTISFDAKSSGEGGLGTADMIIEYGGKSYSVKTSALVLANNEYYVKVENLKKTVDLLTVNQPAFASYSSYFTAIVDKIDNKWIKITEADINELSGVSKQTVNKCSAAVEKLRLTSKEQKITKRLFKENQFIVASQKYGSEKVDGEDSFHYKLDFNDKAASSFARQILTMSSFGAVKTECKINADKLAKELKPESKLSGKEPVLELWVSKSTRRPTKLRVSVNDKGITVDLNTKIKLNTKNIKVGKPDSSISIKQLKTEIEKITSTSISNL